MEHSESWVEFLVTTGETVRVAPGGIIGRLESAALRLNDPRLSEAHAMVSLRQGALWLLGLRGRLMCEGKRVKEVELAQGLSIGLGAWYALKVLDVMLPESVPGLESADIERIVPPPVVSFSNGPAPFVPGFVPESEAVLWSHGGRFYLERPGVARIELNPGDQFNVAGRTWRVVDIPIADLAATPTGKGSRQWSPLQILLRRGNVHIVANNAPLAIDGTAATIIQALAATRSRHPWAEVAALTWPEETDAGRLRVLWDGALARLRKRLATADIRTNLVRMDGVGNVELFLGPDDRVACDG